MRRCEETHHALWTLIHSGLLCENSVSGYETLITFRTNVFASCTVFEYCELLIAQISRVTAPLGCRERAAVLHYDDISGAVLTPTVPVAQGHYLRASNIPRHASQEPALGEYLHPSCLILNLS